MNHNSRERDYYVLKNMPRMYHATVSYKLTLIAYSLFFFFFAAAGEDHKVT